MYLLSMVSPLRNSLNLTSHTLLLTLGPWLVIIALAVVLIAAFELWMLVDVALNKHISDHAKAWWIVGMVLIHPLVAIIYFFTDRNKQ